MNNEQTQFVVTITETLVRDVTVTAPDEDEAVEFVRKQYKNGEQVLGAEDFLGVDIGINCGI